MSRLPSSLPAAIDPQIVHKLAWIGSDHVVGEVTGIVLRFPGLGVHRMKVEADFSELEWGHHGALVVMPYHDPWGWMNPRVVAFVDDLVDAVRLRYGVGTDAPVIATGGSMGAHGALIYTLRSRQPVAACMANCPICDLPFHYSMREDLIRTMQHAFGYPDDLRPALEAHSPLHLADRFPDVPYLLVQGEQDHCVKKEANADRFAAALRRRGLCVEYVECPGMRHCTPIDYPASRRMADFVLENLRPQPSALSIASAPCSSGSAGVRR